MLNPWPNFTILIVVGVSVYIVVFATARRGNIRVGTVAKTLVGQTLIRRWHFREDVVSAVHSKNNDNNNAGKNHKRDYNNGYDSISIHGTALRGVYTACNASAKTAI